MDSGVKGSDPAQAGALYEELKTAEDSLLQGGALERETMAPAQKRFFFVQNCGRVCGMNLREVRPLYSQDLELRLGKLRLTRLSLNRHLPEKDWVARHSHGFAQFLVYLTGQGRQQVADRTHLVRPGCVFLIPPRVGHSFIETTGRRPLCLAIDLALPSAAADHMAVAAVLTRSEMNTIRHALSALTRWQEPDATVEPREAAAVFQVADVLLRAVGRLPRSLERSQAPIVRRVHEAIQRAGDAAPCEIAERVGYHPDHLNRLLKQSAGVSIGQVRAEIRLRRAKALLQTTRKISDAAWKLGFGDPNYFSRWFRQQTGFSPGAWRRHETHPA